MMELLGLALPEQWFYFILAIFISSLIFFARVWSIYHNENNFTVKRSKNERPASILIVVGSGGHTREILSLSASLGTHYRPRYYVMAETDVMSRQKVEQCESDRDEKTDCEIFTIPRSREVKQSYLTSIFTTCRAMVTSFPLVFKLKPDVVLCNGPGTCIPICCAAFLLKVFFIKKTHIVYVESFCRVTSMSLSGKLLYYFADAVFVQWPELAEKYPRCKYIGRLV